MPAKAAGENWICNALNAALLEGFNRTDKGLHPRPWPACLPRHLSKQRRDSLERRGKLGEAVTAVVTAYEGLNSPERAMVREAREDQLALADLFDGARTACTIVNLPLLIQGPLGEFAERVFTTLDDLGVRGRSYGIHDREERLACAFCGYEAADSSLVRVMDWDHYLAKSLYPFAGANLLNFSPMGDACNGSFKKAKDMLRDEAGTRRVCFDPYTSNPASIDLLRSTLFARGRGNELPDWVVTMTGDAARCATWDSVFAVRVRWIGRLDQVYKGCVKFFGHTERGRALSDPEMTDRISRWRDPQVFDGMTNGGFLPAAVFGLWTERLNAGGAGANRLRRLLRRSMVQTVRLSDGPSSSSG